MNFQKLKLPYKPGDKRFTWTVATLFLVGGIAVGGIARGVIVNYGSTTTIQGQLPPPGYTTYYSNYTNAGCDGLMTNAAAKNQQNNLDQHAKGLASTLASSLQACLSNMANMSLPGIPSLNLAGLMSALENQACQMAQSAVSQATMPMYGIGGGSMLNTQSLASQLTVPGTNGGVNLGSALTTSAPTSLQSLSQSPAAPRSTSIFRQQ
jgi:hypothetical protein